VSAPWPGREHLRDCPADTGWDAVDCDCGGRSRQRVGAVRALSGAEWMRRMPEVEAAWWRDVRRRFIAEYRAQGLRQVRPPEETTEYDEEGRMVRLIVEGWAA